MLRKIIEFTSSVQISAQSDKKCDVIGSTVDTGSCDIINIYFFPIFNCFVYC